jgi:hypothetical protein
MEAIATALVMMIIFKIEYRMGWMLIMGEESSNYCLVPTCIPTNIIIRYSATNHHSNLLGNHHHPGVVYSEHAGKLFLYHALETGGRNLEEIKPGVLVLKSITEIPVYVFVEGFNGVFEVEDLGDHLEWQSELDADGIGYAVGGKMGLISCELFLHLHLLLSGFMLLLLLVCLKFGHLKIFIILGFNLSSV